MKKIIILFFVFTILSCKNSNDYHENHTIYENIDQTKKLESNYIMSELFDQSLRLDTLEFQSEFEKNKDFVFFKSGNFFKENTKNALFIFCPTDSTYSVRLYIEKENNWKIIDSIGGIEAFPSQFYLVFNDYNFDGHTDIFIQVSATSGWSISRGHLLTIDPITSKFNLHKETFDFGNMVPDNKSKTVRYEKWNGYDMKNRHQLTYFTNKWKEGKLITVSKKDTIIY